MLVLQKLKRFLVSVFFMIAVFHGFAGQAIAKQKTSRLVYLPDRDLEISYVGEKGRWCAPRLDLVLVTSKPQVLTNTDLIDRQLVQLILKLRQSCPMISKVGISGYDRINPNKVLLEGSYWAKDAWKFSKFKLAVRLDPVANENSKVTRNGKGPGDGLTSVSNRKLNSKELSELQRYLSFFGFPIDNIDGTANRETIKAITNFVEKYGLDLPVRADLDMLRAARKISGSGKKQRLVSAGRPRGVSLSSFQDVGIPQQINFGRRMSFWVLSKTPSLLRNRKILSRWLEEEGKDNYSPIQAKSVALYRLYRKGTKFQRKDVLDSFRKLIETEARQRAAEFQRPFRVKVRLAARVSDNYQDGVGFPIRSHYSNGFGFSHYVFAKRNELSFFVSRLGVALHLPLPKKSAVKNLPILNERKARIVAKLLQNQRRYKFEMRFYLTISDVGFLTDDGQILQGRNVVDYQSLEMIDRDDLTGKSKLVHRWNLKSLHSKAGPNKRVRKATAQQFAKWAGIDIIRGSLVLADWNKSGRVDFDAVARGKLRLTTVERKGWAGFANLLSLQRNPSLLNFNKIGFAVANSYLTRREKSELERNKNFLYASGLAENNRNFNEFEFREFMTRFKRGRYAERVKRYFPPFPIPIVNIQTVQLGRYDFSKGAFPITFGSNARDQRSATWKPVLNLNMHEKFDLQKYPQQLSLSPANAKRLLELLKRKKQRNRAVYLAIFAQMDSTNITDRPGRYNVQTKRVALYLDRRLKQRLAEFSVKELTAVRRSGPSTSVDISRTKLEKLYDLKTVNGDQLARVVEQFSKRKGFEGAYVRSMSAVVRANELEKEKVTTDFLETLRFVARPSSYWMRGTGYLGRYDSKREGFPIIDWFLDAETSYISSTDAKFRTETADVERVAFVKMERVKAAALLEKYPSRKFLVRVRVSPYRATWKFTKADVDDPQLARYPQGTIFVKVNEIYLLADPNSDRKNQKALINFKIVKKSLNESEN